MQEECLICGAPLEYLDADTPMTCALCGKTENSKTRCVSGHYVCSECHMSGMDSVIGDAAGFPISDAFLDEMKAHRFSL